MHPIWIMGNTNRCHDMPIIDEWGEESGVDFLINLTSTSRTTDRWQIKRRKTNILSTLLLLRNRQKETDMQSAPKPFGMRGYKESVYEDPNDPDTGWFSMKTTRAYRKVKVAMHAGIFAMMKEGMFTTAISIDTHLSNKLKVRQSVGKRISAWDNYKHKSKRRSILLRAIESGIVMHSKVDVDHYFLRDRIITTVKDGAVFPNDEATRYKHRTARKFHILQTLESLAMNHREDFSRFGYKELFRNEGIKNTNYSTARYLNASKRRLRRSIVLARTSTIKHPSAHRLKIAMYLENSTKEKNENHQLAPIYQHLNHCIDIQQAANPFLGNIKEMISNITPVFQTGIVDVDCHPNNIAFAMMNEIMLRRFSSGQNTHQVVCNGSTPNGPTSALALRAIFIEQGFICTAVSSRNWIFNHVNKQTSVVVRMEFDDKTIGLTILGEMEDVLKVEEVFKDKIGVPPCTAVNYLSIKQGQVQHRTINIPNGPEFIPHQCFYPFLDIEIEKLFTKFMESRSNSMFFLGPPGTGKSTLLSGLCRHPGVDAALAYNDTLFQTSECVDHFMASKQNVLIMEDVAKAILPRGESATENSLVATFLNSSNGIANNYDGKKFVFSTNLTSLKDVDGALLRGGRNFASFEFTFLTIEQAEEIGRDRGVNVDHIYEMKEKENKTLFPLADILNPPVHLTKTPKFVKKAFGFVG